MSCKISPPPPSYGKRSRSPFSQNPVEIAYSLVLCLFDRISLAVLGSKGRRVANKVLLVRLDALGDFILWLDAAQHIRKHYPEQELILMANTMWADLARRVPFWDQVWDLDRKRFVRDFKYRYHMLKRTWEAGFSVSLQPTFSREFAYGDAVVRASKALHRIGSVGDCANISPLIKKLSDAFYTRLIPASPFPETELERNGEFMRGLGVEMETAIPDLEPMCRTVKNPLKMKSGTYYVLSPGAGREFRRWPVSRFGALADSIYGRRPITCVICGSSAEKTLSTMLQATTQVPMVDMTGKTTLPQLAAIIRDARFVIANETAAIHMAASFRTPAFCLLGGGHYGRFMPYAVAKTADQKPPTAIIHEMDCFGCNWKCRYGRKKHETVPCILNITVERVLKGLKNTL